MGEQSSEQLWRIRSRSQAPRLQLLKRLVWSVVQATLYRYSFHSMDGWRAMLLRLFGARIGPRCTIRRTSKVYYPWKLELGELACLGDDSEVYNLGQVTIGQRATLSQQSYLCAGTHDYRQLTMPLLTPPIVVENDAWVCARAFVAPGVTVGEGAIVAAAAVAVQDVQAWTIVGGNPAVFIKERERAA